MNSRNCCRDASDYELLMLHLTGTKTVQHAGYGNPLSHHDYGSEEICHSVCRKRECSKLAQL